jgi:hypothetical protein
MLDKISQDYAGRVAPVQWNMVYGLPLYSAEGWSKWWTYPPPYGGGYVTPWLWVDGKSRGSDYSAWTGYVSDQLLVPSDVRLTHVGTTYYPATRAGQVQVECYNGGLTAIDAALQVVITEDSCYYLGSNGDPWHNHVCRDYLPDHHGTPVTLAAGAADTVTLSYSLDTAWVEDNVKLVAYLQNMTPQSDSSMPCYQGAVGNVLSFVGVEEQKRPEMPGLSASVSPNPCRTACEFTLSGAGAHSARIALYSSDGRLVSNVQSSGNRAMWSRGALSRGIYPYRITSGTANVKGKLVVAD